MHKRTGVLVGVLGLAAAVAVVRSHPSSSTTSVSMPGEGTMQLKKATPVMIVDAIEPILPFWVGRLGFEQATEVPDGDRLGFVILLKDGVELMFQTWRSVLGDAGSGVFVAQPRDHTPLFIEVTDLGAIQQALGGEGVLVAERTTFYGSRETIVRTPYGQVVTFAQFPS